ncbi:MAG TPA: hypothetical protein VHG71_08015 [Verrucomicrobiae bacterium]|nr:hypothetical protein [Verrucomicrobiae bacterium]
MRVLKKILLAAILFVGVFLICLMVLFFFVFGDHVERKESIARSEATNFVNFPLVNSATNIFIYTDVGGLQSLDAYTRLTVAEQDLTNQINLIIATDNARSNSSVQYERKNADSEMIGPPLLHRWNKPISWWAPEKITNGFYIGKKESYAYEIWVDENSGTLFIHQND